MSKQLDLTKPLPQEEIDDLLTKHPIEKVEYWVAVSSGSEFGEESSEDTDYGDLTVPELQDRLRERDLSTTGNKQELVDRLEDSDQG
jgi:hypothetical protein